MKFSRADLLKEVRSSLEFLKRSTRVLTDEDSNFTPTKGQMSCAQQLGHVAQTIEWFLEGAFRLEGFDMDFEKHSKELAKFKSVSDAQRNIDQAYKKLVQKIESTSDEEWEKPIASGMIMGGEPRRNILTAIIEHTAHHRGALTVYSRMLGKVPPMPYMDM